MRLALIRQRYNPFGGAERIIERAIDGLAREGVEVTLVTRRWKSGTGHRSVVVDPPYIGRLWRDASFASGVHSLLKRVKFDLVQSHERLTGCDVYRAGDGVHRQWLDNRLERAPLLERAGIRINPYHWYVCAAERSMFEDRALRAVICNSNMVAAEIRRHFLVPADKLHVIYNGVDLERFHPDRHSELRTSARTRFGCGPGDIVLAFVGSGFSRKGLGSAIAALAASQRGNLRLLVAGRDRATARFKAQAVREGVGDRVKFLGGLEDVRPVYAASDCFILPTRYDPFPNAALEAFAMGVPVIVSNRCGAAELVERGANGWVCDVDDVASLARLIDEVSGSSRIAEMKAAARRTAEAFGIDRMANRMIALYRQLLGLPETAIAT